MTVSLHAELAEQGLPVPARSTRRRLQVLILDDQGVDRMRLIRILRRTGLDAEITEVDSITAFETALDRCAFDIVFIDFWLGFEDGLDALQILQVHPRQMRAMPIMLSNATEPQIIIDAMRAGCADYIVKENLDIDSARHCIASAFERRILLGAMREGQELRRAIRRLVERLAQGRVPGLNEAQAGYAPQPSPQSGTLPNAAARRLSTGLLADLELLWALRRDQSAS